MQCNESYDRWVSAIAARAGVTVGQAERVLRAVSASEQPCDALTQIAGLAGIGVTAEAGEGTNLAGILGRIARLAEDALLVAGVDPLPGGGA